MEFLFQHYEDARKNLKKTLMDSWQDSLQIMKWTKFLLILKRNSFMTIYWLLVNDQTKELAYQLAVKNNKKFPAAWEKTYKLVKTGLKDFENDGQIYHCGLPKPQALLEQQVSTKLP